MRTRIFALAFACLFVAIARPASAQLLFSFEDGTVQGFQPSLFDAAWDDQGSEFFVVSGPGNTDGSKSLKVVGRAGGYVRSVAVFLSPEQVTYLNEAVANDWNLAYDWTIVKSENPGNEWYLSNMAVGSSAGWAQIDMSDRNGFPTWDAVTAEEVQTISTSIPLSVFGSGTLGVWGVSLGTDATMAFLTLALSGNGETGEKRTFYLDNFRFVDPKATKPGDFNGNGSLDVGDIDSLTQQSASGKNPAAFDLNKDTFVNAGDINVWVKDLFKSWIGDANLDGEFNSGDLVSVLASGTYETSQPSVWSRGDFDGDGFTSSGDLVAALTDGGYERGPRAAVAAVPEPQAAVLVLVALGGLLPRLRRR